MQDFLKGIKNLGAKAKSTVKDIFTLTDEEKSKGKKPNAIEKTTKTVGDFFAPAPGKTRVRDVVREVPGATADVGKEIAKGLTRFAYSAGEAVAGVPLELNELINPGTKYKVPIYEPEKIPGLGFLGPIESYQNQAKREMAKGESGTVKSLLKTAGNIAVDEPVGVAFKPLGLAVGAFIKGGGDDMIKGAIDALAKSNAPEEIKTILGSLGIGKKAAGELSETLAKANTADEVKAILGYTDNVAPKAGKEAGEAVSRETAPVVKDPVKRAKSYGFESFADDMGGPEEAKDFAKQFWAKSGKDGTYYHVTEGDTPFTAFDKTQARNYDPKLRNGGISMINGLYIGKDKNALKSFYGMDKDVQVLTFKGEPKLLDLMNRVDEEKFITDVMKKYGVKDRASAELGEAMEKEIAARGYDGAKYFDPYATGEEIVITNAKAFDKAPKAVARETADDGVKSIGDLLKERGMGGDITPPKKPTAKGGKAHIDGPERRFITRTKEMAPEMSDLLKGKYTPKSNKVLIETADDLIKKDYAAAENMARTGTDDQSVAVASRMIEDELEIAKKATDEATKNKAYAKAAEIANDAARNLTEAGRTVQAASLLGKMTPEGMARYAARQIQKYNEQAGARTVKNFLGGAKKIPELTPDQLKEITDAMETINKMADGTDKARALQKLGEKIQSYIPSTLYQKIVNVWKAGLLTGMKTTGVNVASNLSHAISEIAKDVPASAVDKIVSLFTGKRTLVLSGKGTGKGAAEGVAKGWDYLKTGFDERNIADKLDYKKVNFGKGPVAKALKGYTDTVFGLLGAEDQPFYYAAKLRSLGNQAAAMAKNEGLKGKAAKEFAQKLIENPTDDMMKYATLDAETAVFQQDSWLARKAQNLQKGLEIVLPFAKTPANVANAMINYSPVGVVKTIIENIGKGRFDQRLFAQGMGRGLTGTGVLAIGSALMANKMMNLTTPTSEKEREQWELEGRIPNSIKIGGKWRNIGVLGPLGMVLIVGGHLREGIDKTGSFAGGLAQSAAGFGSALTEQSFLSGVNRAIDALKDPNRSFEGFASSLAGSVVPTLVADIARGMDQYERRTDGMIERIQSRIPGARKGLEPKVDAFGKEVETPNFFEVMADPTRPGNPTAEANDPVLKELRRLMDADYPVTPTQLGPNAGYASLTPEQNTFLWKLAGQAAKAETARVMNTRQYKNYDDEQKSQVIDRAIQDAKTEARARVVLQALKGLSDAEQKSKLAEMKEDGLLTRSVFDLYLSLKRKQ